SQTHDLHRARDIRSNADRAMQRPRRSADAARPRSARVRFPARVARGRSETGSADHAEGAGADGRERSLQRRPFHRQTEDRRKTGARPIAERGSDAEITRSNETGVESRAGRVADGETGVES